MKQYLELMQKVLDEHINTTVPEPERFPFLVIRCVLTCRMDSRW